MINQQTTNTSGQQYCGGSGGSSNPTNPANRVGPTESLAARAANLDSGLSQLNARLQEMRWKLFGDESKEPSKCDGGIPPSAPVQRSIESAQEQLGIAHDQVSTILGRA